MNWDKSRQSMASLGESLNALLVSKLEIKARLLLSDESESQSARKKSRVVEDQV